jgi:hypothetical protein
VLRRHGGTTGRVGKSRQKEINDRPRTGVVMTTHDRREDALAGGFDRRRRYLG